MPSASTPAQQTQQTSSSSGPPAAIQPQLQGIVGDLTNYYQNNPTAPAYYPGDTVAPMSAQTGTALNALYNRGASGSALGTAASQNLTDTANGKYLDIASNPYFQGALAAGFAPQNDQFNNVTTPAMRSQFEGSGRNLGGADMSTYLQARKNLDQTQSNAAATASNAAYGAERGLQMTADGMAPAFQNMDYQNINAMGQAGAGMEAYTQKDLDSRQARWNYEQTAQPNYLTKMAQMFQSIYPGGQSTGSSTGMSMPSTNPTASGIGAGLAGLGTVAQFLPFLPGFSDVRLKKNVVGPVGETNSGHNLYRYEFLGSDKPEIGVLAHEVERKDPDAVMVHPSGYKMVDYGRVAAPGGLM